MSLAIFDLDNTLLNGDSDYLWGQFLVEKGIVDGNDYEKKNQKYYQAYQDGTLDILEFLRFSLHPLSKYDVEQLNVWHQQFMQEKIRPIILEKGRALLEKHNQQGDTLLIITATNLFITEPIARELGVDEIIATEPEIKTGRYTGEVSGIPCFREDKIQRLKLWLEKHELEKYGLDKKGLKVQNTKIENTWFYSDSHNDIPLLEKVSHPVATDPDNQLRAHAQKYGWPIISLRD